MVIFPLFSCLAFVPGFVFFYFRKNELFLDIIRTAHEIVNNWICRTVQIWQPMCNVVVGPESVLWDRQMCISIPVR